MRFLLQVLGLSDVRTHSEKAGRRLSRHTVIVGTGSRRLCRRGPHDGRAIVFGSDDRAAASCRGIRTCHSGRASRAAPGEREPESSKQSDSPYAIVPRMRGILRTRFSIGSRRRVYEDVKDHAIIFVYLPFLHQPLSPFLQLFIRHRSIGDHIVHGWPRDVPALLGLKPLQRQEQISHLHLRTDFKRRRPPARSRQTKKPDAVTPQIIGKFLF
jgi:hypothetical protein